MNETDPFAEVVPEPPPSITELFRRMLVAHEMGDVPLRDQCGRELVIHGVSVKFRPIEKPDGICLHCDRTVQARGVCKTHRVALLDMVKRGEVTEDQLIEKGFLLPSKKPWTHCERGIREELRDKIRNWRKQGVQ